MSKILNLIMSKTPAPKKIPPLPVASTSSRRSPTMLSRAQPKSDKMQEVWFVFKVMEGLCGLICIGFHVAGFLNDDEPLPHHMYFCGTFFGFTIISIFGNIGVFVGATQSIMLEAIVACVGFCFYCLSSIFSMYHAEKDFHLMYLSDHEEATHPYFFISKGQSISALICAVIYLLHAIFAIDAIVITEESVEASSLDSMDECVMPIKLYVLWEPLVGKIAKTEWGRKIFKNHEKKGLAKNV